MKRLSISIGLLASGVTIACGIGFIADCRRHGRDVSECWVKGEAMISRAVDRAIDITAGAAVGGVMGYWTLNPALHKNDRPKNGRAENA
jgi:hypothetical protein